MLLAKKSWNIKGLESDIKILQMGSIKYKKMALVSKGNPTAPAPRSGFDYFRRCDTENLISHRHTGAARHAQLDDGKIHSLVERTKT